MKHLLFSYRDSFLFWQNFNLLEEIKKINFFLSNNFNYQGGFFLYNEKILKERLRKIQKELPAVSIFYSVKSLSNIHILKILNKQKVGVDVVSSGEIYRSLEAGFSSDKIIFAGVGKTDQELSYALEKKIYSFHVESLSEIFRLITLYKNGKSENKIISIAIRVNPDIEVDTHGYIQTAKKENKFGIDIDHIKELLEVLKKHSYIRVIGLQIHLGSQLNNVEPYQKSLSSLVSLGKLVEKELKKPLKYISLGGGFAVDYLAVNEINLENEFPFKKLQNILQKQKIPWQVFIEPGRYISAMSGVLIGNITYIKKKENKKIAIMDVGMSDFIRPALYNANHPILPIVQKEQNLCQYDIVGPICESADFFVKDHSFYELIENDILAILHCGAYGSCMGSHYNSRIKIPEVLLKEDNTFQVIRKPEKLTDLIKQEY